MSLAVAIQMDPIESINIDADSTFMMALEGQRRGHALFHYLPQHLSFRNGRLYARVRPWKFVGSTATTSASGRSRRSIWRPWTSS